MFLMLNKILQNKNGVFLSALAVILLFGFYLRISNFINIPDLYGDEASLAFNLFDRNITGYFLPLDFSQAAPPLFLVFTKFITLFVSDFEYSLRVIPFLASILSICGFYFLSSKFFSKKASIIAACAFFALNPKLIAFSCVFKQYSLDVLIYVLILISYFYLDFNKKDKKFYSLLIFYAVSIWFSFPAMFAFAGVFLAKLIQSRNIKNIVYALPFIVSFIVFYIFEGHLNTSGSLHAYWADSFINYNFSNIFNVFNENLSWFFASNPVKWIFIVLFCCGLFYTFKNIKDEKNILKIILLFITLALSYLHIYPFSTRTSLYVLPLFILIAANTFEYISLKQNIKKIIICILAVYLCLSALRAHIFKSAYVEKIEMVLGQAKSLMEQDDNKSILYIPRESTNVAKFYFREKPRIYDFKNIVFEDIEKDKLSIEEYIKELDNLKTGYTYYYIFIHYPKKLEMLNSLYLWAKDKKDFKIYTDDTTFDALIIFKK